jgi:Tropinone reductase 1
MSAIAILGATGTIGSVLARRLVWHGHPVLLVGRDVEKLSALGQELAQPFVALDMTSSQQLEQALQAAADVQGGLHGLVNCIGSLRLKPAYATTDEDFRRVIETNLFTAFAAGRSSCSLRQRRRSASRIMKRSQRPKRA